MAALHSDFVERSCGDDDVWAADWRSLGSVAVRLRRQRLILRTTCWFLSDVGDLDLVVSTANTRPYSDSI